MVDHHKHFTRRDFIKAGAAALGGIVLVACQRRLPGGSATAPVPPSATSPSLGQPAAAVADMLLVNGNIITVDPANTTAQALAITNGLVMLTGSSEAIRALAGPSTST